MKKCFVKFNYALLGIASLLIFSSIANPTPVFAATETSDVKVDISVTVPAFTDATTWKQYGPKYVKLLRHYYKTDSRYNSISTTDEIGTLLTDSKGIKVDASLKPQLISFSVTFKDVVKDTGEYYACVMNNDTNAYSICSDKNLTFSNKISFTVSESDSKQFIKTPGGTTDSDGNDVALNDDSFVPTVNISGTPTNEFSSIGLDLKKCTIIAANQSKNGTGKDTCTKIQDLTVNSIIKTSTGTSISGIIKYATTIKTNDILKICIANTENCSDYFYKTKDGKPEEPSINITGTAFDESFGTIGTSDKVSSCSPSIGGLGWILCPVTKTLANIADGAYNQIEKLLILKPSALFDQNNSTYKTWQAVRNIANVLFVIVFLIIIYSQMTGFGITNYGVKKMLPRLIIAAILVNISFYLCQIAVDITNIAGSGLKDFLENIVTQGSSKALPSYSETTSNVVGGGVLLASGVVVTIAVWNLLPLLAISLLAAVVAVLVVLLILVARQAVIIMLIVIAPMAFVAYLLPNTAKLFDKWKKMFISLLIVYPTVAVVMGASTLVAEVLNSAFADTSTEGTLLVSIIVATANIIPLFVVPAILKKSLDAVPMLGKFASDLSNKANSNVGKQFGETYKNTDFARTRALKKKLRGDLRDERYLENVSKGDYGGAQNLSSKIRNRLGMQPSAIENKLGKTSQRALDEMIKGSVLSIQTDMAKLKASDPNFDKDAHLTKLSANDNPNRAQSRAAMNLLATMGRDKSLSSMVGNNNFDQVALEEAMQANFGTLSKTSPDLVMGEKISFSNVNGAKLAGFSADTVTRYMNYLNDSLAEANKSGDNNKILAAQANVGSFLAAVEDIQKDNSLQTAFSSKAGIEISSAMDPTRVDQNGNSTALVALQGEISKNKVIPQNIVDANNRIRP